jgi:hypothetical protein
MEEDVVNRYFKLFYPAALDPIYFEEPKGDWDWGRRYRTLTIASLNKPRIECVDGFNMSVQASYYHYATPRDDFADHYTHVEVGFPSMGDELLTPYADDPEDVIETIYGYVPVEIVVAVIEKHGGIK